MAVRFALGVQQRRGLGGAVQLLEECLVQLPHPRVPHEHKVVVATQKGQVAKTPPRITAVNIFILNYLFIFGVDFFYVFVYLCIMQP
jgi:hypothetical protein